MGRLPPALYAVKLKPKKDGPYAEGRTTAKGNTKVTILTFAVKADAERMVERLRKWGEDPEFYVTPLDWGKVDLAG